MKKLNLFLAAIGLMFCNISAQAQTQQTAEANDLHCGDQVQIEATPEAGYEFVQWEDGNTENPRIITMTAELNEHMFTAIFQAKNYTVSAISSDPEMGTVTGSGSYQYGSMVTLTATPSDAVCYEFQKWVDADGNEISTNAEYTFQLDETTAAIQYKAVFAQRALKVSVKSDNSLFGTVSISRVP